MRTTASLSVLISLLSILWSQAHAAAQLETLTLTSETRSRWLTLDAILEPVNAATVSAQTSGRIIRLNYDVDDQVPAGAALLEITSKEQGAELASAEADYAAALAQDQELQAQYQRYKALFPQGAISRGTMDEATAKAKSATQAVSVAKARVVKATESLKYTIVSAPFGGIVSQRFVQLGETVAPGQPLMAGYSPAKMRAVAQVPQRYATALKQAAEVRLTLADGRQYASSESRLFSFADPLSHSYRLRMPLPENEPGLTPGAWAKLAFVIAQTQGISIPTSALLSHYELSGVYLKRGDDFELVQVRPGQVNGDEVEILAGLNPGDVIAVHASRVLANTHPAKTQD
ncbi:efflux RND transporter periplasmic adaptor subunit [Shewanella salipaludis]|uniref:Efflux RND transporter periplasmic adaptor subunit n=1 Tax=Shewanella salipaludis TaxID=2723052 RepID=A0A972FZF8_9GAMM|nr:efflux RND transporter periplasmic adaptor subunit [Shewanella salipaludis]NMH66028.1 efflux RND transporter periplasmic adaptor subunit [Shewanella salipaludis]